ncbi:MAG: AAA family ATPase [Verrucomicrobiota bacterium]
MDRVKPVKIHVFGPSGSGTTTLGESLNARLGLKHLDTDNFYWKKTEVPFSEKNSREIRIQKLREEMEGVESWVLTGSMSSWGDDFVPMFTHLVYLWIPWKIRKQRLLKREHERYGEETLAPGGRMHSIHEVFIDWASKYDTAGPEQRSRIAHEAWIQTLPPELPVIRVEEDLTPEEVVESVIGRI